MDNKQMNRQQFMDLIQNSTYLSNVVQGLAVQKDFFGATKGEGMAYSKDAMYNNNQSNVHANMSKNQSNYMNLGRK